MCWSPTRPRGWRGARALWPTRCREILGPTRVIPDVIMLRCPQGIKIHPFWGNASLFEVEWLKICSIEAMMSDPKISSSDQPSIVVDGISKTYGEFIALNQISFTVQPGEIVGFLGPNGAGKSTTMKILTCFMDATAGRASVAGFDVRAESKQVRSRVGYLPESVPLYDDMIVYDYLNFIAEMREIPRSERPRSLDEAVERTGLKSVI